MSKTNKTIPFLLFDNADFLSFDSLSDEELEKLSLRVVKELDKRGRLIAATNFLDEKNK